MEDIKKIPALRFPEFSGEWEVKKLEKCNLKVIDGDRGKNYPNGNDFSKNGYCLFLNAKNVTKNGFSFEEKYFITKEKDENLSKGKLKRHDIILTTRGTVGNISYYNEKINFKHIRINSGMVLIRNENETIKPEFLYKQFNSPVLSKQIKKIAFGSAQPQLTVKEIKKFKISTAEPNEQQKISDFLTKIDTKIEQLTKKKQLLESYKKGVMQKIFSQELRFKDDEGEDYPDWEEKRLGEICNIKRGASPRPIADSKWFDENSNIGWVRISDVTKSKKYLNKTTQYLSNEGVKKSRLIEKGSLIMGICATIGKPIYTNFTVCIHDGFVVFDKLSENKEFIYYYLDMIKKTWYKYGQPGIQVNLNSNIVSSEKINLPSIPEQTKIANFLTKIDNKINLVEKQLTDSKQYKKSLLQQMFV